MSLLHHMVTNFSIHSDKAFNDNNDKNNNNTTNVVQIIRNNVTIIFPSLKVRPQIKKSLFGFLRTIVLTSTSLPL